MKKVLHVFLVLLIIYGCSKKNESVDPNAQPPSFTLSTAHIKTEQGRLLNIKGVVQDNAGIKSIQLTSPDAFLDKVITFSSDSVVKAYNLDYNLLTPKDFTGDKYSVTITATNLAGKMTKQTVLVTMDGDFVSPVFTVVPDNNVTVLLKINTRLNLRFTATDDKALDSVIVKIPELNYSTVATVFTNSGRTLTFNSPIDLPSQVATYHLTLTAIDKAGLRTVQNSVISVSEMPDFPKMYLTDVANAAQLNSDLFGIPMLISRTAPYTYSAQYYSEAAGTPVRFVPQKTDFSPICFGMDPLNNTILTDDPDVSLPIVLPSKGYYQIDFNVKTGNYTVQAFTPNATPVPIGTPMYLDATRPAEGTIPLQIGLVGSGIPGAGNWSPASPLILNQDSENKFLFSVRMDLEAGKTIQFIIQTKHSWGWWPEPFWRWDRPNDPEANVANGGENPGSWTIKATGKYMFKFDSYLKRSRFYPIN